MTDRTADVERRIAAAPEVVYDGAAHNRRGMERTLAALAVAAEAQP